MPHDRLVAPAGACGYKWRFFFRNKLANGSPRRHGRGIHQRLFKALLRRHGGNPDTTHKSLTFVAGSRQVTGNPRRISRPSKIITLPLGGLIRACGGVSSREPATLSSPPATPNLAAPVSRSYRPGSLRESRNGYHQGKHRMRQPSERSSGLQDRL